MQIEYTTDGIDFHFVSLTSSKKKINQIFGGTSKKEVTNKLVKWVEKNMTDVPIWKIKSTMYQLGN